MPITKDRYEMPDLRIYHGAGGVFNVAAESLSGVEGTTLDALRKLAAENVRDPELLRTLNDTRLVIQTFSDEPEAVHQRTVSPQEDFAKIAASVRNRTLEMSVAVAHRGG